MDRAASQDCLLMRRALELARLGEGHVEPNPMVGCVIARNGRVLGEGWHAQYGGPHAEVMAVGRARGAVRGATAYVTLEPCSHHGKTPPCTDALVRAQIARVVAADEDPFPAVAGSGIAALRAAGISVEVGLLRDEARQLTAPYRKLVTQGKPWMLAKWAMTLDGKIATRTGDSRWISGEASRRLVHALRGRVDAILIGVRTALADDPQLTARPPGPRCAARIVVDSQARLPLDGRLIRTLDAAPLIVAVAESAPDERCRKLLEAGVQVVRLSGTDRRRRLGALLDELGRRRMTNVLVEGGGELIGELFDGRHLDEVLAVVAPKLVGGRDAVTPAAGSGVARVAQAVLAQPLVCERLGDDICLRGRLVYR